MKHPQSIQISIPQPCHEDWNKMTTQEQGRFCSSCQKCVLDFTGFSDVELLQFYNQHKGERICGQYKPEQLNRRIFVPKTRNSYYKWFISLGFVIFLSELLGNEAKGQQAANTEISDTTRTNTHLKGDTIINKAIEQIPTRNAVDIVNTNTMGLPVIYDKESIRGDHMIRYIIDAPPKKHGFLRRMWYGLTHPFRKRD